MLRLATHLIVTAALTALTQLGGLAYVAAVLSHRFWVHRRTAAVFSALVFIAGYGALSFGAQQTAPYFGRVPLPCFQQPGSRLKMANFAYCALNRHYVTPRLLTITKALAAHMAEKHDATTLTLDANFPFLNGFPLLPHLSHSDGRKLDLAFHYTDQAGRYVPGLLRSPIGYWAFEQPAAGAAQPCNGRQDILTLRWDMEWFGLFLEPAILDPIRNGGAVRWLAAEGRNLGVTKILLEPHLKQSFGLDHDIIRFQGCRAARHDDHIHFQVSQ